MHCFVPIILSPFFHSCVDMIGQEAYFPTISQILKCHLEIRPWVYGGRGSEGLNGQQESPGLRKWRQQEQMEWSQSTWETPSMTLAEHRNIDLQTLRLAIDINPTPRSLLRPHHNPTLSFPNCLASSWVGTRQLRGQPLGRVLTHQGSEPHPGKAFSHFCLLLVPKGKKILIVNITLKACHPTASSAAIHQPELYSFMVKHFILMFSLLITDTGFKVLKPAVLSYLLGFSFFQVAFSLNKVFVLLSYI